MKNFSVFGFWCFSVLGASPKLFTVAKSEAPKTLKHQNPKTLHTKHYFSAFPSNSARIIFPIYTPNADSTSVRNMVIS